MRKTKRFTEPKETSVKESKTYKLAKVFWTLLFITLAYLMIEAMNLNGLNPYESQAMAWTFRTLVLSVFIIKVSELIKLIREN